MIFQHWDYLFENISVIKIVKIYFQVKTEMLNPLFKEAHLYIKQLEFGLHGHLYTTDL